MLFRSSLFFLAGEGLIEYDVLHSFPFDSVRKRMSIVLRHPNSNQIILYCKGADTTVFSRLKSPSKFASDATTVKSSRLSSELVSFLALQMIVFTKS